MTSLLVRHTRLLDVEAGAYLEDHDILAVDGRIAEVGRGIAAPQDAATLEAGGATALPGLVDAHVHVTAATADLSALPTWAPYYVAAHSSRIMRGMLERGFTTSEMLEARTGDWSVPRRRVDVGALAEPHKYLRTVVQAGRVVVGRR